MMRVIYLFVTFLLVCNKTVSQTETFANDSTFTHGVSYMTKHMGDSLYECSQYKEAVCVYEKILTERGVSADIYYNLGNAYYKLDDMPHAILNYERALLLDQGDSDILANLALARGKIVDKIIPASEMFFVTWWYALANSISVDSWAVISIASLALILFGFWMYIFIQPLCFRKVGVYGALIFFLVFLLSIFAAMLQRSSIMNRDAAIVTGAVVTVKSSPNDASTALFLIHGGSKVKILDDTMNEWIEVKLEEGKEGWILRESVEII